MDACKHDLALRDCWVGWNLDADRLARLCPQLQGSLLHHLACPDVHSSVFSFLTSRLKKEGDKQL